MIVVFGSINLDLFFPMEELPVAGQTLLSSDSRLEPGGKGANQAVAAARDGARVAMAGAVGRDGLADSALAGLKAAGVDLSRVARLEGVTTGCAAICTDAHGRNQIAVGAGANLRASAAQVEEALFGAETVLLTQMECAADETAALIRRARKRGARIIHNHAPARVLDLDALQAVDVLVVNEEEGGMLGQHLGTGSNAASLHAALGIAVVCTLGPRGLELGSADGHWQLPAHAVEVKDSTGAGDCFCGVLAAGLDRGLGLRDALYRANIAAALSCTRPGSQASLPTAEETGSAVIAARTAAVVG